jgi:hypothetical protein
MCWIRYIVNYNTVLFVYEYSIFFPLKMADDTKFPNSHLNSAHSNLLESPISF